MAHRSSGRSRQTLTKRIREDHKRLLRLEKLQRKGRLPETVTVRNFRIVKKTEPVLRRVGDGFVPTINESVLRRLKKGEMFGFSKAHFLQVNGSQSKGEKIVFEMVPKALKHGIPHLGPYEIDLGEKTIRWLKAEARV